MVYGRYPRWTPPAGPTDTTGLRDDLREVVITTMLDAEPTTRHLLDGPTIIPLLTALAVGVGVISGIFTPWGFVVGAVLVLPCMVAWFWPKGDPARELAEGRA